jgi:hypothetical protein
MLMFSIFSVKKTSYSWKILIRCFTDQAFFIITWKWWTLQAVHQSTHLFSRNWGMRLLLLVGCGNSKYHTLSGITVSRISRNIQAARSQELSLPNFYHWRFSNTRYYQTYPSGTERTDPKSRTKTKLKLNSVPVVRKRTIPTKRPPLSEFLATDPEVLGSIPGPTRFSEK